MEHEDIETFKYETLQAKGDLWIKLTDALKMAKESYREGSEDTKRELFKARV